MPASSVLDDAPNADAGAPRVILIDSASPPPAVRSENARQRPEPWTPREGGEVLPPVRREAESAQPTPAPLLERRHRMMFAALCAFGIATVLGTLTWRLAAGAGDQPTSPSGLSTAGSGERGGLVTPGPDGAEGPEPGLGPVATEIVVLQPNYTVAPGDTLAAIARRHGTSIEALASINKLENRNSLSVGQRLILP